jgi:hypothetical protein
MAHGRVEAPFGGAVSVETGETPQAEIATAPSITIIRFFTYTPSPTAAPLMQFVRPRL